MTYIARAVSEAARLGASNGRWRQGLSAVLAATTLLASACASTSSNGQGGLVDRVVGGGHVHGDADQVTVSGVGGAASALPFAVGHCARFGKSAQYESRSGDDYTFRCVSK